MTTLESSTHTTFRWDRFTVAAVCCNCMLVAALGSGLVLPELRSQFHISGVITALHGSMFGVGLLFFGIWGVRIVGRTGRRQALVAAVFGIALGVTVFVAGPAWPITLFGMTITGFAAALMVTVMPAVISDHHGEHRAAAFGALAAIPGYVGLVLAVAVGVVLSLGGSWRLPFIAFTAIVTVIAVATGRSAHVPAGEPTAPHSLRRLGSKDVSVPWLQLILTIMTDFSIGVWAVTYLREIGGASAGAAPILCSVFGSAMGVSRLRLASIQRWLGEWTVTTCYAVAAIGVAMLCFIPVLWVRVVALGIFAFGAGPLYPLAIDRLYRRTEHSIDPVTIATYSSLANGLAVVIGPLALGALADMIDLRWAILISLVLSVAGLVIHWPRRSY